MQISDEKKANCNPCKLIVMYRTVTFFYNECLIINPLNNNTELINNCYSFLEKLIKLQVRENNKYVSYHLFK